MPVAGVAAHETVGQVEVLNLTTRSRPIEALLVKRGGRYLGLVPVGDEVVVPTTPWRERGRTGDVIEALTSAGVMPPGDTPGS